MGINISMDIHGKSVDTDMDMDEKFYIYGKPGHVLWSRSDAGQIRSGQVKF